MSEKLRNIKAFRKTIGVILIIYGFVALVTPMLPGAWFIFIGLEILGIKLVFWDNFFLKKDTIKE